MDQYAACESDTGGKGDLIGSDSSSSVIFPRVLPGPQPLGISSRSTLRGGWPANISTSNISTRSTLRGVVARQRNHRGPRSWESSGPPVVVGSLTVEAECSIWLAPVGNTPLSVLQYGPAARYALAEATASGVSWKVDPAGETLHSARVLRTCAFTSRVIRSPRAI